MTSTQPNDSFVSDFRTSIAAWKVSPNVPLIAIIIAIAFGISDGIHLRHPHTVAFFDIMAMISIAFIPIQRIWYLRVFHGQRLGLREMPRLIRAFFFRFVRLGLLAFLVILPVAAILPRHHHTGKIHFPLSSRIAYFCVLIVLDVAFTFVTPLLTYNTSNVREALVRGLRMVRSEWPKCALYVLAPPLAILFIPTLFPQRSALGVTLVVVGGHLIAMAMRGTSAAYVLRLEPPQDVSNGSAFTSSANPTVPV